jgi:hypothetical protein
MKRVGAIGSGAARARYAYLGSGTAVKLDHPDAPRIPRKRDLEMGDCPSLLVPRVSDFKP